MRLFTFNEALNLVRSESTEDEMLEMISILKKRKDIDINVEAELEDWVDKHFHPTDNKNKVFKFKYEEFTGTIRTVPENYCVICIKTFANHGYTDKAFLDKIGGVDAFGEFLEKKLNS